MLHVIATPIGNLGDLSPRALEAFKTATLIACEDTRRTWQLLTHFGIPRPEMVSYRQGNEEKITARIVAAVKGGAEVALCSDGGYPGISDPGYRLIRTCAREGVPYEVVPGASAVNVALLMSGLSTSSFTFRGFPPRGPGALRNWFAEDADKEHTLVCYESPFRIAATLEAALDALGDREAAVCIELTKLHERVSRGYLSDLVKEYRGAKVKGEVALVIAGSNPKFRRGGEDEAGKIVADASRVGETGAGRPGYGDSEAECPEYEVAGIETIARGVCVVNGKVLLCKPKKGGYTYLPGGHIEFGETGREALVREIEEELGLESEAGELLGVVESRFEQHGKPHAEISLVYRLSIPSCLPSPVSSPEAQEDWIAFEWRDVADLDSANLLPPEMKTYVRG